MSRTWTKRGVSGCSSGVAQRRRSEDGLYGILHTTLVVVNVPSICPASDLSAVGFYFRDV